MATGAATIPIPAMPGILALLAFASGSGPGFSTIFELRAGVIERFRVTPASRLAILAGPILASMLLMFAFDAVVVAIGAGLGFGVHVGGLLLLCLLLLCLLLALLMATVAAFSIAIALTTGDISGFAAIINGLNLPVLLLGGVLLPIFTRTGVDAGTGPISTRSTTRSPPPGCWRPALSPALRSGRRSPCSPRCAWWC